MKYNTEQIKDILKNAPRGSQFYTDGYDVKYRKVIGDKYFGYLDEAKGWVETCDKQLSQERIDKGWWLANLIKELENQMNIDKVETQTEHQEEMSAFSGEVEWNSEGLPPVGVIYTVDPNHDVELLCKYSSKYVVVGEMLPKENYKGIEVVIDTMEQRDRAFRKPETPQQREDRERLEAAFELCCTYGHNDFETANDFKQFHPSLCDKWLAIVDKTNYRKGVK